MVKEWGGLQIFEVKWGEVAGKLQVQEGHINYIHTIYV